MNNGRKQYDIRYFTPDLKPKQEMHIGRDKNTLPPRNKYRLKFKKRRMGLGSLYYTYKY